MISFFQSNSESKVLRGRVDFTEPMLNILAHAQSIELDIGSRCGGHGICGGDRVQLASDDRDLVSGITEIERSHLSQEELDAGWRLACQCFPNTAHQSFRIGY